MTLLEIVLIAGGVCVGLHAGLLYDFAIDIVPSMRKLKPKAHIDMFHAINNTIVNPVFMLSFLGPIVLLPFGALLSLGEPVFWWVAAAAAVQILGSNVITASVHLPLNAQLAKVDTSSISDAEAEKIRTEFQGLGSKWNRFHGVRTLASTVSLTLALIACLKV